MNTNNGWLDIASAPKDGTEIIVFHPEAGVCAAFCPGEGFAWHCMDGMNTVVGKKSRQSIPSMTSFILPPTHWMPLPAAPGTPPASAQDDAKEWGTAFDAWFAKRGVWPRVNYDEIFAAGWNARPVDATAAGDAQGAVDEAFRILRAARGSIRAHQLAGPTMLATDSRALTNADDDILRAMKALKSSQQQEG